MFENFIKQDVDDMIFGSTKQIISERGEPLYPPRESVAFLFLSPERQKGPLPREFSSREADFSCLCTVCVIYFFG